MSHHVSTPHSLTADSHLSGSPPLSPQVSFSNTRASDWSDNRHPAFPLEIQGVFLGVKLEVNQFMHGPIPHILIHESQVKYSQKHICPCVDIYSRPLNGNGWPILGNKRYTGRYSPAPRTQRGVAPDMNHCSRISRRGKLPRIAPMVRSDGITDHSGLITYLFLLQTGQSQSWPDTTLNSRQFLHTRTLQPLKCTRHVTVYPNIILYKRSIQV